MPESSQCPARLQPYWVSPWTVSGRPAAGLHGDHGETTEIVFLGHSGDWVFRWPGLASPDCGCGTGHRVAQVLHDYGVSCRVPGGLHNE